MFAHSAPFGNCQRIPYTKLKTYGNNKSLKIYQK